MAVVITEQDWSSVKKIYIVPYRWLGFKVQEKEKPLPEADPGLDEIIGTA